MKRSICIPALYVIKLLIFCFYLKPRLWQSYDLCRLDVPGVRRMPLYYPMDMRMAFRKIFFQNTQKKLCFVRGIPQMSIEENAVFASLSRMSAEFFSPKTFLPLLNGHENGIWSGFSVKFSHNTEIYRLFWQGAFSKSLFFIIFHYPTVIRESFGRDFRKIVLQNY